MMMATCYQNVWVPLRRHEIFSFWGFISQALPLLLYYAISIHTPTCMCGTTVCSAWLHCFPFDSYFSFVSICDLFIYKNIPFHLTMPYSSDTAIIRDGRINFIRDIELLIYISIFRGRNFMMHRAILGGRARFCISPPKRYRQPAFIPFFTFDYAFQATMIVCASLMICSLHASISPSLW